MSLLVNNKINIICLIINQLLVPLFNILILNNIPYKT